MNNIFRGLIAGYGAKKLGGGCFSTILVFIIIYWALGQCGNDRSTRQTAPSRGYGYMKQKPTDVSKLGATTATYSRQH